MKKSVLIILTILSVALAAVGAAFIPILSAMGVNVFNLRGILIFVYIPVVAVFCIPLAFCCNKLFKKKEKKDK